MLVYCTHTAEHCATQQSVQFTRCLQGTQFAKCPVCIYNKQERLCARAACDDLSLSFGKRHVFHYRWWCWCGYICAARERHRKWKKWNEVFKSFLFPSLWTADTEASLPGCDFTLCLWQWALLSLPLVSVILNFPASAGQWSCLRVRVTELSTYPLFMPNMGPWLFPCNH